METVNLDEMTLSRKGRLHLSFAIPQPDAAARVELLIAQREEGVPDWTPDAGGIQHSFPVHLGKSGVCEAQIDLAAPRWHDARWDVIVLVSPASGGRPQPFKIKASKDQRKELYNTCTQAYLPGNAIMFPYLRKGLVLAFVYRERVTYDAPLYHVIQRLARRDYYRNREYYDGRRIWLVYEKQCMRAQDNGYYFFKYCMENLPKEERDRIFFVIDRHSPDYGRVMQYGKNVLDFMGYRHLLYCMAAEMLVASETDIHLLPFRSRPSSIKHKLRRTMTFFLQHGVMAFKRTEKRMGADGMHPVDYFLVSSDREQEVIVGNFGYPESKVPVLGQARWDALEDRSSAGAPTILLMPTWREWLLNDSEEEFKATEFFRNYDALLNSPQLAEFLAAHNATLKLSLHPNFLHLSHLFESSCERIQVLSNDGVPLNEVIMGCSVMITDYSSAVWDAVYLDKPALFFQFDRETFVDKTGTYIDFETELPGDCFMDAPGLIEGLEHAADGGFVPSQHQKEVAAQWFAHRDRDNCKRIYEYALKIEREMQDGAAD